MSLPSAGLTACRGCPGAANGSYSKSSVVGDDDDGDVKLAGVLCGVCVCCEAYQPFALCICQWNSNGDDDYANSVRLNVSEKGVCASVM